MASSRSPFLPEARNEPVGWLFPGQGAQETGMGKDLWENSAAAKQVFETAERVLGFDLARICFEGPDELLRETEYAQPAILAVSLACLAAAVEKGSLGHRPAFLAGHSLGEYSALVASGALSLEEGLRLLQERAHLMARASEETPGTLAAIIGLDESAVIAICEEANVDICNLNLPSQTVIGGRGEAVARAVALAKERGAQRAMELNVSGAFHSRLMQPAAEALAPLVAHAQISAPKVPVIGNSTGAAIIDADGVRSELSAQVAKPVRWHRSITLMANEGVSTYIEFGPGRVLSGLVRRLVPGARVINVSGLADIGSAAQATA